MYDKAMMHCDIKEPNIMVKSKDHSNPQIALIDFGLTKSSAGDGQSGCTPGFSAKRVVGCRVGSRYVEGCW